MLVKELTKKYDGKAVVDSVSFEIPKGKVISLIGPNGAGKSTVMGIISRLIARDSGAVNFSGTDIAKWKSKELSKHMAILTQSNNIQMKLTVRELISFGRFPYSGGRLTEKDKEIVDRAIKYMELNDMEDRFIDELSGGQRQRAYIAMVIAQDTEYVLLDEPTNNLDIYHATNMMKMVRRLCDELGKTIILVLHEINYAAFYSDYICAFVKGKIAKFGTVKEVMTKETLAEIYDGRCSIIGVEIGFENLGNSDVTSTHGNEASFELIVEKNPDYIFVMDRDAAIGKEGAQLAKDIMENDLVKGTDAYKNGNMVYLANPAVWYTAEGGINALDIMLSDLESELLK